MTAVLSPTPMPTVGVPGIARLLPRPSTPGLTAHLARLGPLPVHVAPQLAEIATAVGLVGRGGGGFPTATKLATVAGHSSRRRPAVVIANCCEGDPTSSKDAVLLMNSPHLVIDGALLTAAAVGADRVIMMTHNGSHSAADLSLALAERPVDAADVSVATIPDRFVASEATSLVRYLNTGDARPAGRLSKIWESGVDGRPTMVSNAETLAHLALLARFGPEWFTSVGSSTEPGTTLITIGGAVRRPGVVEVAGGTSLHTILASAGDIVGHDGPRWALIGGLAGRWIDLAAVAGIGFSTGELAAVGATKGVGSIVALPPKGCLLAETAHILQYLADAGARQCGPCMFGLPAIASDMAMLAHSDRDAPTRRDALTRLHRRLPVIDRRGGCAHPDGAVALAASALRALTGSESGHLELHLRHGRCDAPARVVPLGADPR